MDYSFCLFFSFLIIDLYFLIPASTANILNPITEFAIPIGIAIKEENTEIEMYPMIVQPKITFLKNLSSSFLRLLQITEKTNLFSKKYHILCFSNFLYLLQITQ